MHVLYNPVNLTLMPDQDDTFIIEDIDPKSWQVREVYAKFGLQYISDKCLNTASLTS